MLDGKDIRRWDIRFAAANDLAAVRRLTPAMYTTSSAPDQVLVAMRLGGTELAGAAAISWRAWGKPAGFPLHVSVVEPERRQGLGRALVRAAALACRGETERFYNWVAIEDGADPALFARAVGFDVHRRTLHYEADVLPLFTLVDAIHARLQQRGSIPANARTISLANAPAASVARLVSATFGTRYDVALSSIQGQMAGSYDTANSVVLVVNGEVSGALLCRWTAEGVPEIDVRVIAPHLQGRWANVALLRHIIHNSFTVGAKRFRFSCEDANTDTISLARRTHALLLQTRVEVTAPLEKLALSAELYDERPQAAR